MTNTTRKRQRPHPLPKKKARTRRRPSASSSSSSAFPSMYVAFEQNKEQQMPKGVLTKHYHDVEKELIRLFKTPFTPSKYRAQDDYYTHINYQWLRDQSSLLKLDKNRKYYVQVDSFRVVQEKVYYELMDMVKEYIRTDTSRRSQISMKPLYHSLYHLNESSAQKGVNEYVASLDQRLSTCSNVSELLGYQNRNEIISWGNPLVWSVAKDEKNVSRYISTLSPPQLTLYDYELYLPTVSGEATTAAQRRYKFQMKKRYLQFLTDLFHACLPPAQRHRVKAMDVWECECELLNAMGNHKIKGEDPDGYNRLTTKEAMTQLGLDWESMATAIGFRGHGHGHGHGQGHDIPPTMVCTSLNYVQAMMELFTKDNAWKSDKWRSYHVYIGLRQIMRFHKRWRHIYFDFHGKFIKGQPVIYPAEIYPIFGLSMCYNTFLTNEYIDRHHEAQYVDYTFNMASDLLTVFKRIIGRNTWLSPSTKKSALLKLEKIKLVVGSPKLLREDPVLEYDSNDAFGNLCKMAEWRCRRFIAMEGTSSEMDIPVIDWDQFKIVGKQSYVVNAYYTPIENSIYVPLAYLQKPFIDLNERGIEYNLAHIGYTLAHEMSHCLDDLGSKYDEKGNLHNWWTKSDRRKFERKVADVIRQYETFAGYDGIQMDASLSTGENLADISGMAICEEYLKDFQEKNEDIVPIKALSFHAFFVYLAVQARQKIFDEAIQAQLKTNPHPMDKYRTNCPLARLELFRSLYNVKKSDKMYWHSTDTIW